MGRAYRSKNRRQPDRLAIDPPQQSPQPSAPRQRLSPPPPAHSRRPGGSADGSGEEGPANESRTCTGRPERGGPCTLPTCLKEWGPPPPADATASASQPKASRSKSSPQHRLSPRLRTPPEKSRAHSSSPGIPTPSFFSRPRTSSGVRSQFDFVPSICMNWRRALPSISRSLLVIRRRSRSIGRSSSL